MLNKMPDLENTIVHHLLIDQILNESIENRKSVAWSKDVNKINYCEGY